MIVKVLKSPFTGRPVIRINDRFNYSAHRVRIGYTLNARYALSIGSTVPALTVVHQHKRGATTVLPDIVNIPVNWLMYGVLHGATENQLKRSTRSTAKRALKGRCLD